MNTQQLTVRSKILSYRSSYGKMEMLHFCNRMYLRVKNGVPNTRLREISGITDAVERLNGIGRDMWQELLTDDGLGRYWSGHIPKQGTPTDEIVQ